MFMILKISLLIIFTLPQFLFTPACSQETTKPDIGIRDAFFFSNASWLGEFKNYVNRGEGVIQNGRILVEMKSSGDTLWMRNAFFNKEGKATDYTGYSTMLATGDSVISLDDLNVDENTGNAIENYHFWGRILEKHIYIHESYREVFPDGHSESRSNSVHYYLNNPEEVIQLAEVYLNDSLLVFVGTRLVKQKDLPQIEESEYPR